MLFQGFFDYVERPSAAGHVLTIIDEEQKKIDKDVTVWFNGTYYKVSIPCHLLDSNSCHHKKETFFKTRNSHNVFLKFLGL